MYKKMIIKIRKQLGWTQAQLADELGTTDVTVSRWENGHRDPSLISLKAIRNLMARKKIEWDLDD